MAIKVTREEALEYHHLGGKHGKISVVPTKPMDTQRDLSLAYTPGVAQPVLEIEKDPELAYEYTSKGNLVAVLSNGTAILGLGVLRAYGVESLKFGPEYIIPKPLDPRVLLWEAPAVAKAAMDTGVARKTFDIDEYRQRLAIRQGMGQQVRYFFMHKARSSSPKKRIVFAEGEETKIIRAAAQVAEEEIAIPILLGCPEVIREKIISLGLDCCAEIINPNIFDKLNTYTQAYAELRQRKGITRREAAKRVLDPNVFGSLMVKMGDADAFVSGLTYEYPEVIRP